MLGTYVVSSWLQYLPLLIEAPGLHLGHGRWPSRDIRCLVAGLCRDPHLTANLNSDAISAQSDWWSIRCNASRYKIQYETIHLTFFFFFIMQKTKETTVASHLNVRWSPIGWWYDIDQTKFVLLWEWDSPCPTERAFSSSNRTRGWQRGSRGRVRRAGRRRLHLEKRIVNYIFVREGSVTFCGHRLNKRLWLQVNTKFANPEERWTTGWTEQNRTEHDIPLFLTIYKDVLMVLFAFRWPSLNPLST